ncbi:MAG: hypothetical protein NT085_04165 [candidate division SR1 bacterium]|nr:hypothetical protein [candidate division SR1 bacterium]
MILQLLILGLVIIVSPLVPPVLVPLSYSMTGALILQQIDPRILSIVSVAAAVIADIIIRKMQNFVIPRMTINEDSLKDKNIFARIINKMNSYFKKEERIGRLSLKWEQYLEKRSGRIITFLFAIFCYIPVIPDIIATRILYKKIKFPYFIIASIIGKSITHIPFIFLGKSIAQLLHLGI